MVRMLYNCASMVDSALAKPVKWRTLKSVLLQMRYGVGYIFWWWHECVVEGMRWSNDRASGCNRPLPSRRAELMTETFLCVWDMCPYNTLTLESIFSLSTRLTQHVSNTLRLGRHPSHILVRLAVRNLYFRFVSVRTILLWYAN